MNLTAPDLTAIVAIDRAGAIGRAGALPWRLKTDMAFFRATTLDHTVIMGCKTYAAIGKALARRRNLVLSREGFTAPDAETVASPAEALARAGAGEAFVIGGAATYAVFTEHITRWLVTMVEAEVTDADAFLPPTLIDHIRAWPAEVLARHPASPGCDDYGFTIMAFTAPGGG